MSESTLDPNDPAIAFRNLQAHVLVARDAAEGLKKHIESNPPPKYDKEFASVIQALNKIIQQFKDVQAFPSNAAQSITAAADKTFAEAKKRLDHAENMIDRDREALGKVLKTVRTQEQQKKWLIWTGAGAFAAGLLFFLILARALPFGLNTYLAAAVVGQDRWNSGQTLMQQSSPDSWRRFSGAVDLATANRDKIEACMTTAAKSKQDQNCSIVVSAPRS